MRQTVTAGRFGGGVVLGRAVSLVSIFVIHSAPRLAGHQIQELQLIAKGYTKKLIINLLKNSHTKKPLDISLQLK
jgi:hypothetical protein